MFIANIAFQKAGAIPENKSFGCIWYDPESHHASILLKGFRSGQAFAKPFDNVSNAPYLEGDIEIWTGGYKKDGAEKDYLYCGWMWTCSDQRGPLYNLVLEVAPWPLIIQREIREYDKDLRGKSLGVFMNINLIDSERKKI